MRRWTFRSPLPFSRAASRWPRTDWRRCLRVDLNRAKCAASDRWQPGDALASAVLLLGSGLQVVRRGGVLPLAVLECEQLTSLHHDAVMPP
ncbi:MAG: hypothetical protein AW07_01035 [Candidatus Accumulibacter sp. SK-11]|nr:MAG: hypothetical protein AW07_01035 [Candidatus Accumulibacter sp. SK-11]